MVYFFFKKYLFIYLFWLRRVLVAACMWDLVPRPGIKPGPPTLGAWSLTHWTTREVPEVYFLLTLQGNPIGDLPWDSVGTLAFHGTVWGPRLLASRGSSSEASTGSSPFSQRKHKERVGNSKAGTVLTYVTLPTLQSRDQSQHTGGWEISRSMLQVENGLSPLLICVIDIIIFPVVDRVLEKQNQ